MPCSCHLLKIHSFCCCRAGMLATAFIAGETASLSVIAGVASGRASMVPGGYSLHGAENDCVLTCSDGFEAAGGPEAESLHSRQLLAGQHGEYCHCNPTDMTSQPGSMCGRRLLL